MNKKIFVILLLGLLLLVLPVVSAVKIEYSPNDLGVEDMQAHIEDTILFNLITIGEMGTFELKSHNSPTEIKEVGLGDQVVMYYDVNFKKAQSGALGNITFIDMRTGKEVQKDWHFVYWGTESYEISVYNCSYINEIERNCLINGTETKIKEGWLNYDSRDIPKGKIRIGIMVNVEEGDYIDGIWEIEGKKINRHSSWTSSLNTNLNSYYKFDESSGTNVADSLGVNNGTASNSAVLGTSGLIGNSADFSGGDYEIDFSTIDLDFGTGDFSISFWLKTSSSTTSVFEQYTTVWGVGGGHAMYLNGGSQLKFATSSDHTMSDSNLNTGNWVHVVLVRNSTGTDGFRSYINGSLSKVETLNNDFNINTHLKLGHRTVDSALPYGGLIDEMAFWDRALTPSEITQLYNGGIGITYKNIPSSTLISPEDSFKTSNKNITFIGNVSESIPLNVSLIIDGVYNETNTSGVLGNYSFDKILIDGEHNWTLEACSIDGCLNATSRTFTIDLTNPTINITYPLNTTYVVNWANITQLNVSFNWTSHDVNLHSCWYSKNGGTNTSLVCNSNLTTNATYGTPINILACSNDSVNNIGCASRTATFKHKIFEINQTYTNPTLENNKENFYANIYLDPTFSINSVYFNYNGTNYSATYEEISNYTRLIKENFSLPSVPINVNKTISWWIFLNDSSVIPLTTRLQQVNNIGFSGVCNGTYPFGLINFTLKDEKTQVNINGTIESALDIRSLNGTSLFNWTAIITNTTTGLCSDIPLYTGVNYSVYGTIKYYVSNENYPAMTEYYSFLNWNLNNQSQNQNIILYDINSTEGTEFQLTYKDASNIPRANILIYVYRQYVSEDTFKVVELPLTDSNGQTIVHLVRNDVRYNLIAVDSTGAVVGSINNIVAFCKDYTIGQCTINLQEEEVDISSYNYLNETDLYYNFLFNNVTNNLSLSFASVSGNLKNIRMEVVASAIVTNRSVCNTSASGTTGTLTCDLSSVIDKSNSAQVYVYSNNDLILTNEISFSKARFNLDGMIFFGFLFLLTIGIMLIDSKEGLIIATILGFIVLISLGILNGSVIHQGSSIIWLIIMGIILLYKLRGDK